MSKFVIRPHMRLQEWVAEEKGYFIDEGLDYVFGKNVAPSKTVGSGQQNKKGAYQTFNCKTYFERNSDHPSTWQMSAYYEHIESTSS